VPSTSSRLVNILRVEENSMKTILIAHGDEAFAEQLESQLRNGGYRVISCRGPWRRTGACIRGDAGYRPPTGGADLMIYDPLLTAVNAQGDRYSLAVDSALSHPDIPMLLAWSPAEVPEFGTLRGIRNLAPHVHAAANGPARLLRQIHDLLVPTPQPTALLERAPATVR
jgi:hypothetical protein